jgi:excisionase family DNA binding protein
MTTAVAPVLISARDAAASLGISERTLWAETRAKRIPCVRIRTRVLYRPAALEEYAAQNEGAEGSNDGGAR